MRKTLSVLLLVCLFVLPVSVEAQGPPAVATPTSFFAFDYLDADLTTASVNRFELQIDGGEWTSVGIPTKTEPITNGKTYLVPVPPLTPGTHTAAVRACNAEICGDPTDPFAFVLTIVPAKAANLRIVSGGQ